MMLEICGRCTLLPPEMSFSVEEFSGDLISLLQAWHMIFSNIVLRLNIIDISLYVLGKGACQIYKGRELGKVMASKVYGLELVCMQLWLYHCCILNWLIPFFKQFVASTRCFSFTSCHTYCGYLFLQP